MTRQLPTPYWSYQETIQRMAYIRDPFIQHLCTMYYATGARLNELMALEPQHIKEDPIRPGIYWITLYTLKQRGNKRPTRTIPITSNEPRLIAVVRQFASETCQDYRAFHGYVVDRTIRRWVRKALGIKVHHLRHLRAHHLGKTQVPGQSQMNVKELQYYFGWKEIKTPNYYLENATPNELLEKMVSRKNY